MLTKSDTRAPRRKDMKEQIVKVALELFASHGYDTISTTEIAQRVGVSQPSIHYYFKNKEALWKAAVDRLRERIEIVSEETVNQQIINGLDAVAALKILIATLHRVCREIPELGQITHLEGQAGGPRLDWLVEHIIMPGYTLQLGLIEKCIEGNVIKPYPPHQILLMLHGAVVTYYNLSPLVTTAFDVDPNDREISTQFTNLCIDALFTGLETSANITKST